MKRTLKITALGGRGDGVAETSVGSLHVPQALPGETVEVRGNGRKIRLERIVKPSESRVEPACRHFGACGGCSLQHMARDRYADWKRGRVSDALERAGIERVIAPLVRCEPRTRRRVVPAGRYTASVSILGFHAAASHEIVPGDECPVAVHEIVNRLGALKSLPEPVGKAIIPLRLIVTATGSGLDIEVDEMGGGNQESRESGERS